MANLYADLQRAWNADSDAPPACSALERWTDRHPGLARFASPAELVRACHHRGDAAAQAMVEALAEEAATDPWAARTVLQALLPGLAALARQHADLVGDAREPFASMAELDQFIVCTAYERITEVAAETPRFRLRTVLDSTWTRLRSHAEAHRRDYRRHVPLRDAHRHEAAPARSDAEELALILVDAVERRLLRPADARLVYTTRVSGHTTAEVAETLHSPPAALVRRRHRVQRVLAAEVLGELRPWGHVARADAG